MIKQLGICGLVIFGVFCGSMVYGVDEKEKPQKEQPKKESIHGESVQNKPVAGEQSAKPDKPEKNEEKETKKEDILSWATTYKEIKSRLETMKLNFELKDKTIFDVVEYFQYTLNINFRVTSKVGSEYGAKTINISLKNVTAKIGVRAAMNMFGLKCLYEDGTLVVMMPDETVAGEYITVVYKIDDLLSPPPQNFEAPSIEVQMQTASGGAFPVPPPVVINVDRKQLTKDDVKDAITKQAGGESWEKDKKVSITVADRVMVVTQTKAVHKEIIEALNRLRVSKQ